MASTSGAIRAGRAFVELFADDSKLQRGLKRASRSLKTWGASAMRIGAAMTAASTAMLAPVAMATRTFMGFEDQMKAVQAVTGATGDQFERLYEKAKELGRTTSFTAAEVAAGMLNLARAGFSTSEINAAIAGMLNLARATGTDLAQATEIAAGTLRAFNLAAGDSTRVADVLVATANNSAQTLEELGESMTYAAPIAHEYGLTLEETAKALGVMANMQIKGSMAGTSMRQAMLRLADPKVQKQIEALGVSVTDLSGNMRTDFGTMMLELGQAMKGMTSGQRLSLIKDLFDQRAAAGMAKLATSDFPALAAAIDNAGGVAAKTAATMDSGIGGAFRRLMSAVEGVQIALGEALAPALSGIAELVTTLSTAFTKWIDGSRGVAIMAVQIAVGIGVAGIAITGLGLALYTAGIALGAIASVVGAVASAFLAILSPVGLVIAAVAGLGGYLVYASGIGGKAVTWLSEQFEWLSGVVGKTMHGIQAAIAAGDLGLAFEVAWSGVLVVFHTYTQKLKDAWSDAKWWFMSVWDEATYNISAGWIKMVSLLESVWLNAMNRIDSIWTSTQAGLAEGFAWIIAKAQGIEDVEGVMAMARQDIEGQGKRRQAGRTSRLGEIEREREGALAANASMREESQRQRQREYAAAIQGAQKDLDSATRRWEEATGRAAEARENVEQAAAPTLEERLAELGATMTGKGGWGDGKASGTFSAAAAMAMGRGTGQDPALQKLDKQIELLQKMGAAIARGVVVLD
jgi:TP901 family phage tail tape measure protein